MNIDTQNYFRDLNFELFIFIPNQQYIYYNYELDAHIIVIKNGWEIKQESPIKNIMFYALSTRQQNKLLKRYDFNVMRLQEFNSIIVDRCNKLCKMIGE